MVAVYTAVPPALKAWKCEESVGKGETKKLVGLDNESEETLHQNEFSRVSKLLLLTYVNTFTLI